MASLIIWNLIFFSLLLLLNFKPYFVMVSDVMCGTAQQSPISESDPIISVLISNYPLANGGYLVSFGTDGPDGAFESYDPSFALDYGASELPKFLNVSAIFMPRGCYYLPENSMADFIRFLALGASFFDMKFLPASSQMHGLLMVKVDKGSFFKNEQEEKVSR